MPYCLVLFNLGGSSSSAKAHHAAPVHKASAVTK